MSEPAHAGVVVVTGSAQGLGRELAQGLARRGWKVACLDVNAEGAEETARLIKAAGGGAVAIACDVTRSGAVARSVAEVRKHLGGLDALVANAGGAANTRIPFLELEPDTWHTMVDRNLTGAFYCGLYYARAMVEQGHGSIVFTSSIAAETAHPGLTHYGAAKGGVRQLMQGMAMELAPHRVRVNAVAPGSFLTPGNEAIMRGTPAGEAWLAKVPMGRFGEPHELTGAVAYLIGSDAGYTTGITIVVDGGFSIG